MTTARHVETEDDDGETNQPRLVEVADGRRIAYSTYGSPDGRPVIVFHGTPGSRLLGGLLDAPARRHGVQILSLDRPGYGHSDPWPAFTPMDIGDIVAAVLDDVNASRAGVVGFSGGSQHALALAATREELVSDVDIVSAGVPRSLQETTPLPQRVLGSLGRRTPRLLGGLFRGQAWLAERAPPSLILSQYTTAAGREKIPDAVAELIKRDFVEAVGPQQAGAVSECRDFTQDWDVPLDEIRCRVRLWHGGRDTNVHVDDARRLAHRLPESELTVEETADHITTLLRSRSQILERHSSGNSEK